MSVIGRPREFDRTEALELAMHAFWRKGYLATSLNDLCEAMGIRSPSLYAAFGSKEALYLEAVDHYARTVGTAIWDRLSSGPSARAAVESVLQAAVRSLPASAKAPAGCMVALGALSEECPGEISATFKRIRLECLERLRTRLRAAVSAGELPKTAQVESLSRFYLGVYVALAVQARDGASKAELKGVVDVAMRAWPSLTSAA